MLIMMIGLLVGLLLSGIVAVGMGLWAIGIVDVLALTGIIIGFRLCYPAKRATLTYKQIMEQWDETAVNEAVPVEPVDDRLMSESDSVQSVDDTVEPVDDKTTPMDDRESMESPSDILSGVKELIHNNEPAVTAA